MRSVHWAMWNQRADLQHYLRTTRELRVRSRLNYPDILSGLPQSAPATTATAKSSWTLAPAMADWLPTAFWTQARADTWIRMTRTTLALYLYHMDTEMYPATMDDLIPKYLEGPQIDPYDGKPLKYRQDGAGYALYSVGEDRVDNGGSESQDVMWRKAR